MTGERALVAVISIFWITAALVAMPGVLLLGSAIATNEVIPDLWPRFIRSIVQASWFAGPAFFLARGSQVARWFAILNSVILLGASLFFAMGLIAGGAPEYSAYVFAVALVFLFLLGALLFDRGLREALARRFEKWNAAERARLQQLEDEMGEAPEK